MKPTIAGLGTLAILVACLAFAVPDEQIRRHLWLFVYLALAACAWFVWRHPDAPKTGRAWFTWGAGGVLAGGILAATDSLIYGPHSGHVFLEAGFGLLAAFVAVSGYVHHLVANKS